VSLDRCGLPSLCRHARKLLNRAVAACRSSIDASGRGILDKVQELFCENAICACPFMYILGCVALVSWPYAGPWRGLSGVRMGAALPQRKRFRGWAHFSATSRSSCDIEENVHAKSASLEAFLAKVLWFF